MHWFLVYTDNVDIGVCCSTCDSAVENEKQHNQGNSSYCYGRDIH